jgi:hypothetical protein
MVRALLVGLFASSCASSAQQPLPVSRPVETVAPAPGPTVGASLDSVEPVVARYYQTGKAKTHQDGSYTWTLRYAHGEASLETQRKVIREHTWAVIDSQRYVGTATEVGDTLALDLTGDHERVKVTCHRGPVAVAAADAVRGPSARGKEPCTDDGRFIPAATRTMTALLCTTEQFPEALAFAPAPGIEYLYVNDDCDFNGGGYRAVAPDGRIARER